MTSIKISLLLMLSMLMLPLKVVQSQNLDSLLKHKRVYQTENIGDRPLPKIDGVLDDEIWSLGEWQGDFTQQQPVGGARGSELTYVKVLYDYSNLFVAIACNDREPDLIRDIFDRRDALSGDMTGIAIDSYFDKRTAFEFNLSAAGQKMDIKHSGDYQWDFNWNAVWDGATSKTDSGWVAEMKIPLSQIRYADQEDHVWGMHVWRWIERRFEEDQWQFIPREAPAMVYLFGELKGVENIRSSRQVELLPYVLGSYENYMEGEGVDAFKFNGGIDAKVGISSDYTLDLSINPDFGQVEADPSVLNLTSFETFYEEKRPFFLEGNEIFDFELDGDIPYYSRRIGSAPLFPSTFNSEDISEIPNRTTLLGATKLTGKSSKGLSLGLVEGLTAEEYGVATNEAGEEREIQVAPLSNYFSSRLKREYKEGTTIVGGTFSLVNRISPDSVVNLLIPGSAMSGGIDFLHYWNNKNYFLEVKSIASHLQGSSESILAKQLGPIHRYQRPDAGYLEVDSLKEQLAGHGALVQMGKKGGKINFNLQGQYRSPGLNLNDMGYIRQSDFLGESAELSYQMNDPGKWIRNYTLEVDQASRWSFGGEHTGNQMGTSFSLMNNKLWRFQLSYSYDFMHLNTRELRGGPALRIDGEHLMAVHISSNKAKNLSGNVGFHLMAFQGIDSHSEVLQGGLTWLPFRKLRLSSIATFESRDYHQQYVNTLVGNSEKVYLVGALDQNSTNLTFRCELFLTSELSLQYYGSPFYSVGKYDKFKRVADSQARELETRFNPLEVFYDEEENSYSFGYDTENWNFQNPDFSFMQFRSNLVFRWEYNLGSTLYLVWAHDRSGFENVYHPMSEITGDLFGMKGNHVFMIKLNFWFSV